MYRRFFDYCCRFMEKKGEKIMKKLVLLAILASFCLGVSSCARTRKLMWWNKDKEESPAFVDEKNPLAVPPEYNVRPVVAEKIEVDDVDDE